jgi:hypothetical protein
MNENDELERVIRALPLTPGDYMNPFQELTAAAGKFNNFTNGDPQLMREALKNIRGIKQRAIDALDSVSRIFKEHTDENSGGEVFWFQDPFILLTELVRDMDVIERRITDRMINGRTAA